MSEIHLHEPFADPAARRPHYFNGRLLTAEDLRSEQQAYGRRDALLGRALGWGVVSGFEISVDDASRISISAGVAITPAGQPFHLSQDVTLRVSETEGEREPRPLQHGDFDDCRLGDLILDTTGTGYYVLTVAPTRTLHGMAPMIAEASPGAASGCGSRDELDAVCFRLLPFDPSTWSGLTEETVDELHNGASADTVAKQAHLRNVLVHACLGTEAKTILPPALVDPFLSGNPVGALDSYQGFSAYGQITQLQDDEIPVCAMLWVPGGLALVDQWAVRRSAVPARSRSEADGEVAYRHFQQRLHALLESDELSGGARSAAEYFRFLPAAGIVPDTEAWQASVFLPESVLVGAIEFKHLRATLLASFEYDPVDLAAEEPVWIYRVRGLGAERDYVLFARANMPVGQVEIRPDKIAVTDDVESLDERVEALESLHAEEPPDDGGPGEPLKAVITRVSRRGTGGLPKWGDEVEVYGNNFGRPGRVLLRSPGVVPRAGRAPIELDVRTWKPNRIRVRLPTDKQLRDPRNFDAATRAKLAKLKWALRVEPRGDDPLPSEWFPISVDFDVGVAGSKTLVELDGVKKKKLLQFVEEDPQLKVNKKILRDTKLRIR